MKRVLGFMCVCCFGIFGATKMEEDVYEKDGIVYEKSEESPFSGTITSYHENERIKSTVSYRNGNLDGEKILYQNNGEIIQSENYKNGELDGESVYFNLNGIPMRETVYSEGRVIGESIYRPDGQLERKYYHEEGALYEERRHYGRYSNSLEKIERYRDYERHGDQEEYYEDGSIYRKGTVYNQLFSGEVVTYYNDGGVSSIYFYDPYGRKIVGNSASYYINGNPEKTVEFLMVDNQERYRVDSEYNENGKKTSQIIYFITHNESQMKEVIGGKEEIILYKDFSGRRISKLAYTLNRIFNTTKFILLDYLFMFNFLFFTLIVLLIFSNRKMIINKVFFQRTLF